MGGDVSDAMKLAMTYDIECPACGEKVCIPYYTFTSSDGHDGPAVELHFDATPFESHACVLNMNHADWSDEMDNTYPSWP